MAGVGYLFGKPLLWQPPSITVLNPFGGSWLFVRCVRLSDIGPILFVLNPFGGSWLFVLETVNEGVVQFKQVLNPFGGSWLFVLY